VQRKDAKYRESHIESLAEYFEVKRNTTRSIEVKEIKIFERTRAIAVKHKWYLKGRYGMIRNLLITNYRIHNVLSIIGALAFTLLIIQLTTEEEKHWPAMIIATKVWVIFTVWERLLEHDGWKVITDKQAITKRLLLHNGTHLSMSGDSPFAQAPLADAVGLYGKGAGVDEMIQGTFDTDKAGMNGAIASSDMHSFLKALQILISATGSPVPTMKTEMTVADSCEIFSKTKETTASSPSGINYGHYISACKSS